jgi:hypothetical protein
MADFEFEQVDDLPDRGYVRVDGRYDIAIVRTDEGIIIDVYPMDWDYPIDTMGVCDNDIAKAEDE